MDVDSFEERAAIMEYQGGLSRFRAETEAAKAQGVTRWEALHEVGKRVVENARHNRAALGKRTGQDNLPGVQSYQKKETR